MALLGTFIDKNSGITLSGVTTTTFNHSLAQQPDETRAQLKSVATASAYGVLTFLANASLATVGLAAASAGTSGTVFFDLFNVYNHSLIR